MKAAKLGKAVSGRLLAKCSPQESLQPRAGEHALWLIPTVLAPSVAMLLMWPSSYEYLDLHPAAHFGDHVLFALLGFAAAYCGERYVRSLGWAAGIALVLTGLLAAGGFGFVH